MNKLVLSKDIYDSFDKLFVRIKRPILVAGPCAVENEEMLDDTVKFLVAKGVRVIRAGSFKPRTSPYDFQGMGMDGLNILDRIRKKYNVKIVSEIVDTCHIDIMKNYVDIFQIGSRNMQNFELLKKIGKTSVPVLLKRGMCSTVSEFISASEYILCGGNKNVILCERGIRTFETAVRNILDLSCVAIIKKETNLPILVDLSHSLGRKDITVEMAKAALVCGSDGIMVEVHPKPDEALSDAGQQMSFKEFDRFFKELN